MEDGTYRTAMLDPNVEYYPSKRTVDHIGNRRKQLRIENEDRPLASDGLDLMGGCELQYEWQRMTRPTCNTVHENFGFAGHGDNRILGKGFWRDVWIFHDEGGETGIFKTMRYNQDFTPRNFDRMRRDAVIMERLTASEFIVDMYSFCGTSSVSEFGEGGDIPAVLKDKERPPLTPVDKLRIGT
jgi:hypothetical protein